MHINEILYCGGCAAQIDLLHIVLVARELLLLRKDYVNLLPGNEVILHYNSLA